MTLPVRATHRYIDSHTERKVYDGAFRLMTVAADWQIVRTNFCKAHSARPEPQIAGAIAMSISPPGRNLGGQITFLGCFRGSDEREETSGLTCSLRPASTVRNDRVTPFCMAAILATWSPLRRRCLLARQHMPGTLSSIDSIGDIRPNRRRTSRPLERT